MASNSNVPKHNEDKAKAEKKKLKTDAQNTGSNQKNLVCVCPPVEYVKVDTRECKCEEIEWSDTKFVPNAEPTSNEKPQRVALKSTSDDEFTKPENDPPLLMATEGVEKVTTMDSRKTDTFAARKNERNRVSMAVRRDSYDGTYGHYSTRRIHLLNRLYNLGEKGSGIHIKGEVQDFSSIRKRLFMTKKLFEDPAFPANNTSVYFSQNPPKVLEWKRPFQICKNPQMFVDGATRFDINQGELGDCWLLASVAALTLSKDLMSQIIPLDQDFQSLYAGIFHFRFWQYGRWVDVVIDDRLPTNQGKLVFLHSKTPNEFWSALLEKAYAKLHGSYEALKGGGMSEAMEDFTGGVTENFEISKAPKSLYTILSKALERSSLIGCSIDPDPSVLEAIMPEGLVKGHAYSITGLKVIEYQKETLQLVRMRNPWGNAIEWKGAWSDKSPEWMSISSEVKKRMGLTFSYDGEFWMSFYDFVTLFTRIEVCNLSPDSVVDPENKKRRWEMSVFEGEWVKGVTAGGCRNFLNTFWLNPQYIIRLSKPDDNDDDKNCTVIVALMQKNRRLQRRWGADVLNIGYAIYDLKNPSQLPKPLDLNFFKRTLSAARSPGYLTMREVCFRFRLAPGTYCIVPTTFDAMVEAEFILRVFSENKNNMDEWDDNVGLSKLDPRINLMATPPLDEEADRQKKREFFNQVAGDDMEVDWMELRNVLNTMLKDEMIVENFSKDLCKSMVAMMDFDKSGKLGYDEAIALFDMIKKWRSVFKLYDHDNSMTLNSFELRLALNSAGYRVNNRILQVLTHRYGATNGEMAFDDFLMCAIRLKTMIDIYSQKDPSNTNMASFTIEEWVENTIYM